VLIQPQVKIRPVVPGDPAAQLVDDRPWRAVADGAPTPRRAQVGHAHPDIDRGLELIEHHSRCDALSLQALARAQELRRDGFTASRWKCFALTAATMLGAFDLDTCNTSERNQSLITWLGGTAFEMRRDAFQPQPCGIVPTRRANARLRVTEGYSLPVTASSVCLCAPLHLQCTYGWVGVLPLFTKPLEFMVERKGIEPSTFALRTRRSPS
jgi:hypothetical protein